MDSHHDQPAAKIADKLQEELKDFSANGATEKLRDTVYTLSRASGALQKEAFADLAKMDPYALKKIEALLPELKIDDSSDQSLKMPIDDHLAPIEAARSEAASIVETGGLGNTWQRHKLNFAATYNPGDDKEVVKELNKDLASLNSTDRVTIEPAKDGSGNQLVVKSENGSIKDQLSLTPDK
jgi:hypothetical protein